MPNDDAAQVVDAIEPAPEVDEAPAHPLHATVDAWFASHFHNSIVSRDTELFNHVRAAVQDLKQRLTKEG